MENNFVLIEYTFYLLICVPIIILVGKSLNKRGRVFHIDNFKGNIELADSINHLLLVGYYLVNVGFLCLFLRFGEEPQSIKEIFEVLSTKIGVVLLVLGIMHFVNMMILVAFRNNKVFNNIKLNRNEL